MAFQYDVGSLFDKESGKQHRAELAMVAFADDEEELRKAMESISL